MPLTAFFRFNWVVLLLVGATLFAVSFLIEQAILAAFLLTPLLGLVLALALEVGKAASIVWHRYLNEGPKARYPLATRTTSWVFRGGLLLLSLVCTLMYLGTQLDRPNLAAVQAAEAAAIEAELEQGLSRLQAWYERERGTRLAAGQALREREYTDLHNAHQGQVDELEALLRAEMDNVQGSTFIGPRYRELERRLQEARRARDRALAELAARQREEADELAERLAGERAAAHERLIATANDRRRALQDGRLHDDERVQDPRVIALTGMLDAVLGWQVSPPQFVFAFALFLSLMIELGILLAFDLATLLMLPALSVQHREAVTTGALLAEVAGTAEREGVRHRAAMEQVRKGAEHIVERATAERDSRLREDTRDAA